MVGGPLRAALSTLRRTYRRLRFPGSAAYWERRYVRGGTSGAGSYGRFAEVKAAQVNRAIEERGISSVIELGCGDGHQLTLLRPPRYIGLDVSPTAIELSAARFTDDPTKSFFVYDPAHHVDPLRVLSADAALSQEVLLHLVEDDVFDTYLRHLFAAADRFVLLWASDVEWRAGAHERHRPFTPWVAANAPGWRLAEHVPSPLPFDRATGEGMLADFWVFERIEPAAGRG